MSAGTVGESVGLRAAAAERQPVNTGAASGIKAYCETHPKPLLRRLLMKIAAVFVGNLPGAAMRLRVYRWMGVRLEGDNFISRECYLDPFFPEMITLGRGVWLSPRVIIQCHNEKSDLLKPVILEAKSWVGAGTIIGPGVRVGKGAVVAAGAVVFNDVPAHSIVLGNPARVVSMVPDKGSE